MQLCKPRSLNMLSGQRAFATGKKPDSTKLEKEMDKHFDKLKAELNQGIDKHNREVGRAFEL